MHDYFAQQYLKISIVGDITTKDAKKLIDTIFSDLKKTSKYQEIEAFSSPSINQNKHITLDIPQTFILMGRPGLGKKDPDWAAAIVANYLIGGGSFNSLLMEKVRTEKSLSYGISSSLLTQNFADLFIIQTSTSVDKYEEMRKTITQALNEALRTGFTHEEIENAKSYLIGSLPLSLTSTNSIANAYLNIQLDGLPATYLQERANAINAVTQNDLKRATARLLGDLSFTSITVGQDRKTIESEQAN